MNSQLVYGRTLMGDSLGFHIIFALFGVGIPLLVCLVELLSILRHDPDYLLMAKRWSYTMSVLFVIGAVSGTIISFQFSLLWPTFIALAGRIIGLPFALEGNAFFLEAIFLGIYLYTWDRFKGRFTHWLISLPIVFGSVASAFFITTANAFMNNPQGFNLTADGRLTNLQPWQAVFNKATPTETSHSIAAYYLTTCLVFAGVIGYHYLKTTREKVRIYYQKSLILLVSLSLVFSVLVGLTGDHSASYIAKNEPIKFAAAEVVTKTTGDAPLKFGGYLKNNQLVGAITIPGLLSWLAFGHRTAVVQGLNAFNPQLWPPLFIHYMFDLMVAIGSLVVLIPAVFLLLYWRRRALAFSAVSLWSLGLAGLLALASVEFGWILTEVGRQPYAIRGLLLTQDAFTTNQAVAAFGYLFPCFYLLMLLLTPWILIRHYKTHRLFEAEETND